MRSGTLSADVSAMSWSAFIRPGGASRKNGSSSGSPRRRPDMGVYRKGKVWWISYRVNGRRVQKGIGTKKATGQGILEKIRVEIRAGRYVRGHRETPSPLPGAGGQVS